ncbi:MAG: hypothetical protein HGA45_40445 [Chloroflexales bacterium]|nr:hypothetical protein [Chloroflexales bacterium]
MTTAQPTTQAAERLAALIDLAREHDDDLNYAEVELLLAASHRRLIIRETAPARPPRPRGNTPRAA